ncbi:MAG: urease accessory protein UreE [Gammaproteobacteria bacterium]|nr:urease accessory protein UreE [Gammaproteobacteria bacterium]MDH5799769.1 urease accessory protein UreE [Gammaproteobacteria bacterium]
MTTALKVTRLLPTSEHAQATLTLPFDTRQKSRFKAQLDSGQTVGVVLERGHILRHGDCLQTDKGLVIRIHAADEAVSTLHCDCALLLSRAAYHLGNRHVPLHIDKDLLRYQRDHVLDAMLQNLGLSVVHEMAPFEPEAGAYAHSHSHSHSHSHNQEHTHEHE